MAGNGEERRREERVDFKVKAAIKSGHRRFSSEKTENLSLNGVFIESDEKLEPGTDCHVSLELTGQSSRLWLEMEGKVARVEPGRGMAIEFTSLDLDSYGLLKHVVEYNQPADRQEPPKGF